MILRPCDDCGHPEVCKHLESMIMLYKDMTELNMPTVDVVIEIKCKKWIPKEVRPKQYKQYVDYKKKNLLGINPEITENEDGITISVTGIDGVTNEYIETLTKNLNNQGRMR